MSKQLRKQQRSIKENEGPNSEQRKYFAGASLTPSPQSQQTKCTDWTPPSSGGFSSHPTFPKSCAWESQRDKSTCKGSTNVWYCVVWPHFSDLKNFMQTKLRIRQGIGKGQSGESLLSIPPLVSSCPRRSPLPRLKWERSHELLTLRPPSVSTISPSTSAGISTVGWDNGNSKYNDA